MTNAIERELIDFERGWSRAFARNDVEAIGQYMDDDWIIVGSDGNIMDKTSFLALVASGMLTHTVMDFEDPRIRIYGDTAVLTATGTSKGTFNGMPFSEHERLSDVFVKRNGEWKCVLTQLASIERK